MSLKYYIENLNINIKIISQYVRYLKFKNLLLRREGFIKLDIIPKVDISLNLNIMKLSLNSHYEVEICLLINGFSEDNSKRFFILDLKYVGVFNFLKVSSIQDIKPVLAIYCPEIIFPYIRKIVADVTYSGGFQAVLIDPVDFISIYKKRFN